MGAPRFRECRAAYSPRSRGRLARGRLALRLTCQELIDFTRSRKSIAGVRFGGRNASALARPNDQRIGLAMAHVENGGCQVPHRPAGPAVGPPGFRRAATGELIESPAAVALKSPSNFFLPTSDGASTTQWTWLAMIETACTIQPRYRDVSKNCSSSCSAWAKSTLTGAPSFARAPQPAIRESRLRNRRPGDRARVDEMKPDPHRPGAGHQRWHAPQTRSG